MSNPVLVEATRGPLVESRHRGAVGREDAGVDLRGPNVEFAGEHAVSITAHRQPNDRPVSRERRSPAHRVV